MSWFSCRRNAAIRASLRRKNTHCPTLVAVIRPARCSTARCVDTVDWDSPQRPSMGRRRRHARRYGPGVLEIRLGILQPRQDLAAHRVGERLEDGVGVDGWVVAGGSGIRRIRVHIQILQFIESYIVKARYMLMPPRRVGILAAFARQRRLVDAMPPASREPCALIHRPPCRAAATSPCSTLRCTRRRCEARVAASAGAAFPCAPPRTMAIRRSIASARFFSWLRNACDLMTMTPSGDAVVVERAQRVLNLGRQAGGTHIEAQMHGAGHLVDVLPARALGADHREHKLALVQVQESWI